MNYGDVIKKSMIMVGVIVGSFLFSKVSLAQEEHTLFTEILAIHVVEGMVNYPGLCADKRLPEYIQQLRTSNPDHLSSSAQKLAFWLNAYNAFTLKIVCDHYPIRSLNELHWGGLALGTVLNKTVWHQPWVVINGKTLTLDTLEHKIIRPLFKDPRVHFALVCAAKSCPPLRFEAYEGNKLEDQLNDQAKIFLQDSSKNSFELKQKRANLSAIFSWFAEDFGGRGRLLNYVAQFLPPEVGDSIQSDPKSWRLQFNRYDWSLNDVGK